MNKDIAYLNGLGNHFESEAIKDVLTKKRNSPQKVPYGLYAEQVSGSAFTTPRHVNLHSWLYRIRPSVLHGEFSACKHTHLSGPHFGFEHTPPIQLRWNPMPYPKTDCNFIQ